MEFLWFLALSLYSLLLCTQFTFTVTNCFPLVQLANAKCHEDESAALLEFKASFVINKSASLNLFSYPKVKSWLSNTDCCSWDGVECDELTGYVIGLDLGSSQLRGPLNPNSSLFLLQKLQSLSLSDNNLIYSHIPFKIGDLSSLIYLNLSRSKFLGKIPSEISKLSKLLSLDLSFNDASSFPSNRLQLKKDNFRNIIKNMTNLKTLMLAHVDISSSVPNIFTNLTSLENLSLSNCDLFDKFPIGIFHLPNLRNLDLMANENLVGFLPDFYSSSLLETLVVNVTSFYGTLPTSIGNLNSLRLLSLNFCNFSGYIPSSLSNLTQLTNLGLCSNNFKGHLPSSLSNLSQLHRLCVAGNEINGVTVSWIGKLTRLQYLNLDSMSIGSETVSSFANLSQLSYLFLESCNLSGEIPSWIMNLTNLVYLGLSNNMLQGEIPPSLFEQENLEALYLSNNRISGSLPSWLWTMKNLRQFDVSGNLLTGEISPLICNLKSLVFLIMSRNNLGGIIPPCLGSISYSLKVLLLQNNNFSGLIPQAYLPSSELLAIDFSQNNLQGRLPKALLNCRMLEYFVVSNNQIQDSFPFWLGILPELKVLSLRSNKFYGTIKSPTNCTFPKLHIIDLSHNDLSGNFPSKVIWKWQSMRASDMDQLRYETLYTYYVIFGIYGRGSYPYSFQMFNKGNFMIYERLQEFFYFIAIDISSNKFNGEIPNVMGDLKGLVLLNMSNNMFTGAIPSSLAELSQLEALDLSHNSLTGRIPQQLVQLTFLEVFDVSHNHLTGPIPQTKQFATFESSSFEGNEGLCGNSLSKKCESSLSPSSGSDEDEERGFLFDFDWKVVLLGFGCGLVVGLIIGSTMSLERHGWLRRVYRF